MLPTLVEYIFLSCFRRFFEDFLQKNRHENLICTNTMSSEQSKEIFPKSKSMFFCLPHGRPRGLLHLLVVVMFGFSLLGNLGNISETLRNSFTFYSFTFSHYLFLNFCHRHGRPTFTNLFLLLLRTFHFYFMTSTFLFLNKLSMGQWTVNAATYLPVALFVKFKNFSKTQFFKRNS